MAVQIIHVVRQFYPSVGGLENFVRSLAIEQKAAGYEVKVVSLDRVFHQNSAKLATQDEIDGICITRIPYFGSYKYPFAFSILSKLNSADIVHVHGIDFFSDFLSLTRFIHRKKIILSTHGGFFHTHYASRLKKIFFNTVTRFTLKNYAAVCACSNNDYSTFQSITKSNLNLIENGVDIEKFWEAGPIKGGKTWIFIGRFSNNKRVDKLIDVIARLVKLDPAYKLLVIGKDWDGNYKKLIDQVARLGIGAHVDFFTGLSDAEIKSKVGLASFIVSASEYEGFGLSLIEGMSAGLIPIASPIKSFDKILADAKLGLINDFSMDNENIQSLDVYVQKVLADYSASREAATKATSKYSWNFKSQEFSDIYLQALGVKCRDIQGVKIDTRDTQQVIDYLDDCIANARPQAIAFANAHTVNQANKLSDLKNLLEHFLVLNDGVGVAIASKLKYGKGFTENLNGTDFIPKYLDKSNHRLRIYLLGSTAKIVDKTLQIWKKDFPQHEWLGGKHGFITKKELADTLYTIKASQPDVLIVAMGNPKQEIWISQYLEQTGTTLAFGVGALFDFTAGEVKRAPNLIIKIKFEWLYRLLQEPRRLWQRYIIGNTAFLLRAWRDS